MIVQCPACSSRYRVNAEKLPAGGGNLKCPSCGHIFFLTPDGSTGEARRRTRASERAEPQPPAAAPEGGDRIPVDELAKELINHLDEEGTDWMSGWGSGGASDEGADARSTAGQIPAAGRSYDSSDFQASGPRIDDEELARAVAEAGSDESHDDADTMDADRVDESRDQTDATEAGDGEEKPAERWKVRGLAGIVYDFPDLTALRRFIGSRESHDGLEVTRDGGETWGEVGAFAELADVSPAVAKQRKQPVTKEPPKGNQGAKGRARSATASRPPATVSPVITAESKSANRAWLWFGLLILILGGIATAHALQIIDIPFLRGDNGDAQSTSAAAPPEDTASPTGQEAAAAGEQLGAEGAERRVQGVEGLYTEMLQQAARLASDDAHDEALQLLHRARATMPNRPDAWCAEADLLERAERPADDARALCNEARRAEAEGRAMEIPEGLVEVDDTIHLPGEMVEVEDEDESDAEDSAATDANTESP